MGERYASITIDGPFILDNGVLVADYALKRFTAGDVVVGPGPTPTPTPAPVFTTQPSISPSSGTAGATTFTASDGAASNATSYTRRWLLSGTAIGIGGTVLPQSAGSLVLEVTATGLGGSAVANSAAVTVAASGPTPTPTPIPSPSITQTSVPTKHPFTWTVAENAAYQPGMSWNVQRATDTNFVPQPPANIVIVGDSWPTNQAGYTGYYYSQRNTQQPFIKNIAVGGTGIADVEEQEGDIIAMNPRILHYGTGRNDLLIDGDDGTAAANRRLASAARVKAACPLVAISFETLTPNTAGSDETDARYETARAAYNTRMRAAVSEGLIAAVVDFAGNATLNNPANWVPGTAAGPNVISTDGLHLQGDPATEPNSGFGIAYPIFAATIDALITASARPAGTVNGDVVQQITPQDLAGTDPIVFTDLPPAPPGPLALRLRVGQETGDGTYTWGPWSNVLTDTLESISLAKLATVNGADKSQWLTVSSDGKTATATNVGTAAMVYVRSPTVVTGKRRFEYTLDTVLTYDGFRPICAIGVVDAAVALGAAVFLNYPGNAAVKGASVLLAYSNNSGNPAGNVTATIWRNGGAAADANIPGGLLAGDTIGVEFDTDAKTVTFTYIRSGAVLVTIGTVTLTSNIPDNWTAVVGMYDGGSQHSGTFNPGSSPFKVAASNGVLIYG